MSYKNHIYFASTLALLSLSTAMYINNNKANADANTNNIATQQTTTIVRQDNQQYVTTNSDTLNSTTATTSNNTTSSTLTASATTQASSAASKAYDGTPIISIGDPNYPRVDAVDISAYQAGLTYSNFVSLKNAGVKTAIVKLTEGTYYTNPYAEQQINNAKNVGMNVQVYHYAKFNSWNEAVAEANFLADEMNRLGLSSSTMIYADMEDNSTKYAGVANNLNGFWQQLNNRGFTNHGVYASTSYDTTYNVSSTVGRNRTWIAQYLYNPTYLANQNYGAWQFNSHGKISGYNGELDISVDYQGLFSPNGTWQYNNGWHYQINGQNVTGWQNINDNWYYFNQDGTARTGWQTINNHTYYFDPSNAWADKGFQYIDGNWYDFDSTNVWMNTGWQYIDNSWYYFSPDNGHMLSGMQTINGQLYDLNDQHDGYFGAMKTDWQFINNRWYYFGNYGAKIGWFQSPAGAWYYFNQDGTAKTGWQTINNHTYYFDPSNAWADKGFQYIDGNWYDFDSTNVWMNTGWQYIDNSWYYFGPDNGHMLSGMQTINGQLYDLNDQHDGYFGAMKTGWQYINNKWYYFRSVHDGYLGAAITGWFQSPTGAWYYFNQDGTAKTGWQTINNHTYYFDPSNAWADKGFQYIDGNWYDFDSTNVWMNTGWQYIDNSWYYFGPDNGHMLSGMQTINGQLYDLNDQHDGHFGAMKTGWQYIKGNRYYFDPVTGKAVKHN